MVVLGEREGDELLLRRSETLGYSKGRLCFYWREGSGLELTGEVVHARSYCTILYVRGGMEMQKIGRNERGRRRVG